MFGKRKDDEQMIGIIVDDTERRIIVRALADFLDTLIVKVCDAPVTPTRSGYERS